MTGKPQLVLLKVLTQLYLNDVKTKSVIARFVAKDEFSPTGAVCELLRENREFGSAQENLWYFFRLFASPRNGALAVRLVDELTGGKIAPQDAEVEFLDLIQDERDDPTLPAPRGPRLNRIQTFLSL